MTMLVFNRRPIVDQIPGWLADIDPDLVLVTARSVTPDRTLAEVAGRYRELVVVDDYDGPDVERLALRLAERHRVRRVLGTAEVDVLRAARIRERLGIPGQGVASATAYRDKFRMKTIAARAGLPVTRMRLVRSVADLWAVAEAGGFPIVVKPVAGGGSVGVRVVPDTNALDRLGAELGGTARGRLMPETWAPGDRLGIEPVGAVPGGLVAETWAPGDRLGVEPVAAPGQLMAETWVSGEALVVDGLMAGGKLLQCWPVRMRYPNLTMITAAKPCAGWMLPRDDELGQRLLAFVADVVAALPAPAEVTAVHAEVFHTEDDRLLLGEIACRPGGSGHTPAFELAFGVSLFARSLRGQAGWFDPVELAEQPRVLAGFSWFAPRRGRLIEAPTRCPLPAVADFTSFARIGAEYAGASSVSDHIARALVAGPHGTDLGEAMAELESWWDEACRWAPAD